MNYLIGIDIGTSGTKTVLVDSTGRIVGAASAEYPLLTPRPGWAEQDPEEWYRATVTTVREVLKSSGIDPAAIVGVGLSGQMHGAVMLDARAQVIRPAILWCDQRTAEECAEITRRVGSDELVRITCNPVLTGFQAPKVVWVKNHEPDQYARIRHILLPKDYIRYRLTGELATEVSDASGTSFLDVPRREWSPEILAALETPASWLPDVFESDVPSTRVSANGAAETGLAEGTPVVGGGGDQAAGAVGNGIVEPGILSASVGTSGVVFAFSDRPALDPSLRVHTFCHAVPGAWHAMGVMLSAGSSLRWFRDTLGLEGYDRINALAASAPVCSEGLIFLPYLTGERTPYPDPNARGVFFGLSLRHDLSHMTRAVMEGVAFGLRDSLEILREMGVAIRQIRASGGGARSHEWLQIMADVMGTPMVTMNTDEGPALGAALLAGVGAGLWPSVPDACRSTLRVEKSVEPRPAAVEACNDSYAIYRGLYSALEPWFRADAEVVRKQSDGASA